MACVISKFMFFFLDVTALSMLVAPLSMALVPAKLGGRDQLVTILWLPQSRQPAIPVTVVKA